MTQSEIMVKLGLDTTNFSQGLDKAKQQVNNITPAPGPVEEKGKTFGEWFVGGFAKSIGKFAKAMVIVQLISLFKEQLTELFDWVSKRFAEALFPPMEQTILDANKAIADRFRKMRMDRQAAEKEIGDIQKEYIEKHLTATQKVEKNWKDVLDHIKEINHIQSDLKKHIRTDENIVKLAQERLALTKAQVALEESADAKKKLDAEQAEKRATATREMQKAFRGVTAPLRGPLDEINQRIIEDAKLAAAYNNPSTRARLNEDYRKREQIVGDLRRGLDGQRKEKTPAEQMTDNILNMLLEKGAIKVSVVNVE